MEEEERVEGGSKLQADVFGICYHSSTGSGSPEEPGKGLGHAWWSRMRDDMEMEKTLRREPTKNSFFSL